jgi:hypothetical protein
MFHPSPPPPRSPVVAAERDEIEDLEIDWHVPSIDEIKTASKLVTDAIADPVARMHAFVKAPLPAAGGAADGDKKAAAAAAGAATGAETKSPASAKKKSDVKSSSAVAGDDDDEDRPETEDEKLVTALRRFYHVLRGAHGRMGPIDGPSVFDNVKWAHDETQRRTATATNSKADAKAADGDMVDVDVEDGRDYAVAADVDTDDRERKALQGFDGRRVPFLRPVARRQGPDLTVTGLPLLPAADGSDTGAGVSFRTWTLRMAHLMIDKILRMAPTQHMLKALKILVKIVRQEAGRTPPRLIRFPDPSRPPPPLPPFSMCRVVTRRSQTVCWR